MMDFWIHHQDLAIVNGDLALCPTDKAAIAQAIVIRLKTLAREWFLDETLGIPYFTEIFGQKRSERFVRELILSAIKTLPGVKEISGFKTQIKNDRTMSISFIASLSDGSFITINESAGM